MDLQERVRLLVQRIEELEEEKQLIRQEIDEAVEFAAPEDLTQGFIDYYYWETEFPVATLAKVLGLKNVAKIVTPRKDIELPCPICGKQLRYEASSRIKRYELFNAHRKRIKGHRWSKHLDFACSDCIKAYEIAVKQSKENKQDKEARRRVKKYGKDMDLAGMHYSLFLQTEYWKKFAAYARKKAEYICQDCGAMGVSLHVHHLTYERRGKERLSDVKVLCKSCHEKVHGRKF